MSKGQANWDSVATWERLVAGIIASGVKLDLKAIAMYYGTTYYTLQNRLRKTNKMAEELKTAAQGESSADAATPSSPAKTKTKTTTPRKPKTPKKDVVQTVAKGRVTKKMPTKKNVIKKEADEEEDDSLKASEDGSIDQESTVLHLADWV